MASILGRLISPGSELRTHRYLTQQSALDELLQTDFSNLSLKNFYSIADLLLKHKDSIEAALFEKEKNNLLIFACLSEKHLCGLRSCFYTCPQCSIKHRIWIMPAIKSEGIF
jgi:hypothetical protein